MKQPATAESYFQSELEKRARQDELAAPLLGIEHGLNLDYLTPKQILLVEKAFKFAERAHQGQQRRTGHSYITHPLAVTNILTEYKLDHQTLCAALLHDVLEDTQIHKEDLSKTFGKTIANIVDGVSKLSLLTGNRAEAQAQNFYKMAMAMARDVRVILVKLADRLHNMRTIGVMTRLSRKRIAKETLDLYVPLALRMGIYRFKEELENLAFEALYPLRADRLERYVKRIRENDKNLIGEVEQQISSSLTKVGIEANVVYQKPEPFGLYQALIGHRLTKEEYMDRFTFRVVVNSPDDCYRTLGIVHNSFKPKSRSFKDYIAIPKKNGYQSIHTTLFRAHAARGVSLKLLIRTQVMDEFATYGLASGWRNRKFNSPNRQEEELTSSSVRDWIQDLLALQEDNDALQFITNLKDDLFPDQVYIFTPQGDIITLPIGACALDFAYGVDWRLGTEATGCEIDGREATLATELESGQTVSINRDSSARPDPESLNYVKTAKARAAIRAILRQRSQKEAIELGRTLLDRAVRSAGTSVKELDFRRLRRTFKEFKVRRMDEIFEEVGRGNLSAFHVAQRLLEVDSAEHDMSNFKKHGPLMVHNKLKNQSVTYAKCCGPLPGDAISANLVKGEGLIIHRRVCGKARDSQDVTERIPVRWSESPHGEFVTRLRCDVTEMTSFSVLADLVSSLGAGLNLLEIQEVSETTSSVRMHISVPNVRHLKRIMKHLEATPNISNVQRFTD